MIESRVAAVHVKTSKLGKTPKKTMCLNDVGLEAIQIDSIPKPKIAAAIEGAAINRSSLVPSWCHL
ncbi:hypothetical protein [Roseibaca sp. Y0-43]|uniref:hypothetical protein n=1 Tax=Roseibaca sp. Y0-43 TaxID=2816854 RepID=UPI001D0CA0AF|nr:hypothetical protein [Roseibaca sp. Y0-43]MCC1481703.1 hypothetical protein [Roseibaca sp. Y0-43]